MVTQMQQAHRRAPSRHHAMGFGLVEVMVGVVIGMAGVIIMLQMLSNAESAKRVTAGGNDAEVNGAIALYGLERDLRAAGYGLNAYTLLGCSLAYTSTADSQSVTLPGIAPMTVNPAAAVIPPGDANTDTVLVMYGNSDGSTEGDPMIATSTSSSYQVSTGTSFSQGDQVVAQALPRPSTCALTLGAVSNVSNSTLTVSSGTSGLGVGSVVYNLGKAPVIRAYAVRNGSLTMCDYRLYNCGSTTYTNTLNSNVWVPVAANVASLRIQYGKDTSNISTSSMTGVVSRYDQITPGSSADTSGLPVYCGWARALTVRVALVSRSPLYLKAIATANAPTWSGSTVDATTNPTAAAINLSGNADWQHYRYKSLESTIPVRNAIWSGSQAKFQGGSQC